MLVRTCQTFKGPALDVSRLDNNLEQQRDKGMKPLVGILTRLIISEAVVKVLLVF